MDRARASSDGRNLRWLLLLPEAVWMGMVAGLLVPGAYAIHLVRHHQVASGLAMLGGWALLYGLLLRFAHKRRWARLSLTVPATSVVVMLIGWVLG